MMTIASATTITVVRPGNFDTSNHWYPKALNATIHPMVNFFLNLDRDRIVSRYCHLNPMVNRDDLESILSYRCKYFLWSGADLFNATSAEGHRRMVVIENNSSPSGQKSMPLTDDHAEDGGYRKLIEQSFIPYIKPKKGVKKINGHLAVFYDKNIMEASGYAQVISDVTGEEVFLVPYFHGESQDHVSHSDELFHIKHGDQWLPIRAIYRYLTQKPWLRLPLHTKTKVYNPIVACLAGGRNKMVAAKAYEMYNAELYDSGLSIITPETIWDVSKEEIPLWVDRMGGHAVIKIPYSNAGQGVYTITSPRELNAFMAIDFDYSRFIVQSLIGNFNWSSRSSEGKYYHVGTIPDKNKDTHVADIRMMTCTTTNGIKPVCIYSRRALTPLARNLESATDSWSMLGTNLSIKKGENQWESDTKRLLLMDRRDFNKLGIGLDDLIEAYIQTVLSTIAIDKMCIKLHNSKGKFRMKLFKSLNNDDQLLSEIKL